MIKIKKDREIIGDQLAKELGISPSNLVVNGEDIVAYENVTEEKLEKTLKAHIPDYSIYKDTAKIRASALAKLAALGLTEDEIAAL